MLFGLLPPLAFSQPGGAATSEDDKALEIYKTELALQLQSGLAKLRLGEKNNDPKLQLEACLELAQLYDREHYHEKELTYLQQAVAIANQLDQPELRLEIESKVAHSLFESQKWNEAYNKSLELFEQHQIRGMYGPAIEDLQRMAETAIQLNNYVKARQHYLKIMQIADFVGDTPTKITALNNMGFTASHLENFKEAAHYFSLCEQLTQNHQMDTPASTFTNLGIAWQNLGNKNRALQNLKKAEKTDKEQKPYIQLLISSIYLTNEDVYNALTYNQLAIEAARKTQKPHIMADAFKMASDIYNQLYEYDKALDFYKKYLALKDSLERIRLLQLQQRENTRAFLDETENNIRQSLIETELKQASIEQAELRNTTMRLQLEKEKQALEQARQQQQIALLEKEQQAREASLRASRLEALRTRQELALATQTNLALQRQRQIAELRQQRQLDSLETIRRQQQQEQRIALLQKEQEVAMKDQEQKAFRRRIYTLAVLGFIILAIVTASWLYGRKLNAELAKRNQRIEAQNREIESERKRAEGLLLNILPAPIAAELKEKGAASPQHYDSATVLFTDFQGFTAISADMHPARVVEQLNECFMKFDEIADRYNLEKIKTIGDSYMCAGGIPVENNTHPVDAVNAAREIRDFIHQRNQRLAAAGQPTWPIRIGIHTGELVAGVVGTKKFAYDIWGDTVNVASRMESNAEAGQINISQATYQLVHHHFDCKYRGEIEVKNKGKMKMYIVQ